MKKILLPAVIVLLLTLFKTTVGVVIYVPNDYPTIQQAVDAAEDGDIIIFTGVYNENLTINKSLWFRSSLFLSETGSSPKYSSFRGATINGDHTVGFNSLYIEEGSIRSYGGTLKIIDCYFTGDSVYTGYSGAEGGGILCNNSKSLIHYNTIYDYYFWDDPFPADKNGGKSWCKGTGICHNSGIAMISYNWVYDNTIYIVQEGYSYLEILGGGIYSNGGTILCNRVFDNTMYLLINPDYGTATAICKGGGIYGGSLVMNNIIEGNSIYANAHVWAGGQADAMAEGGGIYNDNGLIYNNLVKNNSAEAVAQGNPANSHAYGGGIFINSVIELTTVTNNSCTGNAAGAGVYGGVLLNSIVYFNGLQNIYGVTGTYSDVQYGLTGTGNIDADPLFANQGSNGFFLSQTACGQPLQSPCVDAGEGIQTDGTTRTDYLPDAGVVDMGFHYTHEWVPVNPTFFPSVALFDCQKHNVEMGESVQFNSVNVPYTETTGKLWIFEGGTPATSTQNNPSITYNSPGDFKVTMISYNVNYADTTTIENCIHVSNPPPPPDPAFTASTTQPAIGESIQFTDLSTNSPSWWNWTFEGGTPPSSSVQNPTVTYNIPGLYDVQLEVGNSYGSQVLLEEDYIDVSILRADIKLFLEGPFNGAEMSTWLNSYGYLPLSQPFNASPWYYSGTEAITSIPGNNIDWLLLELRTGPGGPETATNVIGRKAVFLSKDGTLLPHDGTTIEFTGVTTNRIFAVVYPRNHLPVISSDTLPIVNNYLTWDFTGDANMAYGGFMAQKELAAGIWGLFAADGNADGQVNSQDKIDVWSPESGQSGYLSGDFNMNGNVENQDKNDLWTINGGYGSFVPAATFSCGDELIDIRDGKVYGTVLIGSQCWMAENLNIGTMINGNSNQSNNSIIEKYCYGNNPANCDEYGGLYQWDEMMQYVSISGIQGICPPDWHIPTDIEWKKLEGAADSQFGYPDPEWDQTGWRGYDAGGNLKETGTDHWNNPNTGATNLTGFTALPGGFRDLNSFSFLHSTGLWWSSSENGSSANYRYLDYLHAQIGRFNDQKNYGYSVRCVQDSSYSPNQPPNPPDSPTPPDNATNQPLSTQLSWTCTDPENDPLTYDVCFGDANPPPQVSTGQPAATYDPGTLSFNTDYYWKVIAHDDHNHVTEGQVWSFSTLDQPAWSCGDPLQVTHTAGDVAPVNKTVNYGTVMTNLTGIDQCWITQNLGSDQQATSATDATEASAGWYWQFNRKQGYKHDGTTRTPNMPWISSIIENTGWEPANDPCTILLGAGWRLPAYTEWYNADLNGGWNNCNDAYNSVLKLHAAGYLSYSTGSLSSRGTSGFYWSSKQHSSTHGRLLYFLSSYCDMYYHNKALGFSGRCLRD